MLRRSLLCLATGLLTYCGPILAQEQRFVRGEAIINAPYSATAHTRAANSRLVSAAQLSRVENPSFSSLSHQRLSEIALRVTIKRKTRRSYVDSVRYLNSRNPCNAPAIKRLMRASKSLSCEPNWLGQITLATNDPMQSNVYSASLTSAARMHLPEAWELTTGSSNVAIAVIDTGIDYNHVDLQANIWSNPGEIAGNGIDDDGDGYVDDIHGIDAYNADSDPDDDQSHGTHVAGTIGAVGNNSLGIAGIAWNVKEIACKAFNSSGVGTSSAIVSCLNYITNLRNNFGINIVATNNSYGGFPYSIAMYNAIAASGAAGIAYVAGAGNNTSDNDAAPFYPASYDLDNVISVGAIDSQANIASFSNYGASSVDISAPGVSVLSTIPGDQYAYFQGTSMATPHITGTIALLMAHHPAYHYSQAISSVLNTGTLVAGLAGKNATGAIVNAEAALNFAAPSPTPSVVPTASPSASPTTGPNFNSAKLAISSTKSKTRTLVTCHLTALGSGGYQSLSGYTVTLPIKGMRALRSATTNEQGVVKFVVRPPSGKIYSARCMTSLTDPRTNTPLTIKSRAAKLSLSTR